MKYFALIAMGLLLVSALSCSDNVEPEVNKDTSFSVTGLVQLDGKPLAGYFIDLGLGTEFEATTNEMGRFVIESVPKGEYSLTVRSSIQAGDSSNVEAYTVRTYLVSVIGNIDLGELIQSRPVFFETPIIQGDNIQLTWSRTDAQDFVEYRLYRHNTAAVDSSNGNLVHRFESIRDTTFIDTGVEPNTHFYRVFISGSDGFFGGSNVESAIRDATTISVTLDYQGPHEISEQSPVYVGFYVLPEELGFETRIVFTANHSTVDFVLEGSGLENRVGKMDPVGPLFLASFLDIDGKSDGSWVPMGSPMIIYNGIDPFSEVDQNSPDEVYVNQFESLDIDLAYDDTYIYPHNGLGVRVFPIEQWVPKGGVAHFRSGYCDDGGIDDLNDCSWRSSNGEVATVDNLGAATSSNVGMTDISARTNGSFPARMYVTEHGVEDPDEITVGQDHAPNVAFANYGTGFGLDFMYRRTLRLDINADGVHDFTVYYFGQSQNNRHVAWRLIPADDCWVAINSAYSAYADSLFIAHSDTTRDPLVDFPPFIDSVIGGEPVNIEREWTNSPSVFTYEIVRDGDQYHGRFGVAFGEPSYAAVRVGTPPNATYGWIHFNWTVLGHAGEFSVVR